MRVKTHRRQLIEDELKRFRRPSKDDRQVVARAVDARLKVKSSRAPDYRETVTVWVAAEDELLQRIIDSVRRTPPREDDE